MLVIILLIILSLYIIKIIFLHESSKIKSKYTQIIERESSNFISTIRSQRHDFVFHLNTLNLMSKQGKYHEISEYIEGITDEVNTINNILPLHSVPVSGLLLYYIEYAKKALIDFQLEIEDNLKDMPMKNYEINQVLGNLLKNAFEHIEEHTELRKEINVRISCQSSHYVISVRNPGQLLPEEINQLFLDGYSKKNNINNEGNGLFSVKRIVDRYTGEIYPELTDEDIEFFVIIPAGSAD
ncbi:sensor histidine kinase [Sediminibacillus albus]|nr:GHKL domain-containing protein [Sediminibacillus albus]